MKGDLIVEEGEIEWINFLLIKGIREHYFKFGILPKKLYTENESI